MSLWGRRTPLRWSLLAALWGVAAWGAEPNFEEVVVTALRQPTPRHQVPGSVAALTRETLELVAPTHPAEALNRLPGVNLSQNSGQEYLPAIRSPVLTGPGACGGFLMAEDGIPLRPAGFCNVNELFEAHLEQAARVEVIPGPGMVLYGSNALHGVVNALTPSVGEVEARWSAEWGSEHFRRLGVAYPWREGHALLTLTRDGGFRADATVDLAKFSVRQRLAGGEGGATLVRLEQATAGYAVGEEAYKIRPLARANPNPDAYRDAQAARFWWRRRAALGAAELQITPYLRLGEMDFLMHFLPGTPLERNGHRGGGIQSAFHLPWGGGRLVAGVDAEWVQGWLKQIQAEPAAGSAFLRETLPVGRQYDYDVLALQLAPFAQWHWPPGEAFDLAVGVRQEWLSYDYRNHLPPGRTREDGTPCGFGGCRYARPADRDDLFSNLSPRFGLSWRLAPGHALHLVAARGFRAPQAVELYRLQGDQRVADLDSERLDSVEIGLRGRRGALAWDLAGYAMEKRNVIFRDSDLFMRSGGRTRHRGLEAVLRWRPGVHFGLDLHWSWARHRYARSPGSGLDVDGNDVDGAPRSFGGLIASWRDGDRLLLELEWAHLGRYYTDPENAHDYPGHDLLHLRARYRLDDRWAFALRVVNLTDRRYATRADYTTFTGPRYFPGAPRTLFLGVEYRPGGSG
ncbi:MAG: hypothetical protein KatS3mg124_1198 [Porticoccaceae bacterium]|nr:MAG: hypothetical protein KatS3mg124_1198 [Porticoccaceae bacterium]